MTKYEIGQKFFRICDGKIIEDEIKGISKNGYFVMDRYNILFDEIKEDNIITDKLIFENKCKEFLTTYKYKIGDLVFFKARGECDIGLIVNKKIPYNFIECEKKYMICYLNGSTVIFEHEIEFVLEKVNLENLRNRLKEENKKWQNTQTES